MATLFPPIEPYASGTIEVDHDHRLYWERVGTRGARPAVVLHGGPGGSASPEMRRLFDPAAYDVLLFDQRGCGRSRPQASLLRNTTPHLVADIECLRREVMRVERWLVFGGSWGSLLALAYAEQHLERVTALILRGLFTGTTAEMDWFYRSGLDHVFPDKRARFIAPVSPPQRADLIRGYQALLHDPDRDRQIEAARAWAQFEREVSVLTFDAGAAGETGQHDLNAAKIQLHYFAHGCFLEEDQILRRIPRIAHLPAVLIHGRYDMTCPLKYAWRIHEAWPQAEFRLVEGVGHRYDEPAMLDAVLAALDRFARD